VPRTDPDRSDKYLGTFDAKPACFVTCLPAPVGSPQPRHCEQVGATLADMHLAEEAMAGSSRIHAARSGGARRRAK